MRSIFTKERAAPLCATLANLERRRPSWRHERTPPAKLTTLHAALLGALGVMSGSHTEVAKSAKNGDVVGDKLRRYPQLFLTSFA
jgi:hypothetical protein